MKTDKEMELAEEAEKKNIREYFGNKRSGIFVDVGANEPVSVYSQSWHLENVLGWGGLLIEPIPALANKAREKRPGSTICECACTAPDKTGELSFYIPKAEGEEFFYHASLEPNADDHHYKNHHIIKVQAKTLMTLLEEHKIPQIDLLSIDVEGTEIDVFLGLDFNKFKPKLILLEDKHVYLQKHFFLKSRGYVLAKRENGNCWYVPRGEKLPDESFYEKLKLFKRMYLSIWGKKLKLAIKKKTLEPFKTL